MDVSIRDSEVAVLPRDDSVRCSKQFLRAIAPHLVIVPSALRIRCFLPCWLERAPKEHPDHRYQVHAD